MFQVWAYSVGMGRLLLRSTKSEGVLTRIDVLFQNVKVMNLPTLVDGLVVSVADAADQRRVAEATGFVPDKDTTFFMLGGAPAPDSYVIAGVVVEAEDEREYFEPSELWPDGMAS